MWKMVVEVLTVLFEWWNCLQEGLCCPCTYVVVVVSTLGERGAIGRGNDNEFQRYRCSCIATKELNHF